MERLDKIGIYFEKGDGKHLRSILPVLKMLRFSLTNVTNRKPFSKKALVEAFNSTVPGIYLLNEIGLQPDGDFDEKEYFQITEDEVYFNEEVDEFLKEHTEQMVDGKEYYAAENKFYYLDLTSDTLERV